ncbi:MAG: hypothetical protein D6731_00395 [Planctomycetota bacterium]|nr:MAG: hypothetical protein D6731_00395 [Planctomycetota bacterium]
MPRSARWTSALLCATALALTGCHTGYFAQVQQTNVTLTSNNYRVLETGLRGSDSGYRVFGIGTSANYSKAMQKIRVLAELEDRPRALINVTVDENSWNYGIVSGTTIVITADLIEFTGPPNGR